MGKYDQLLDEMVESSAELAGELRSKLGARILLALLFQEAADAVLSAKAKGAPLELTESAGNDAFALVSGFGRVHFERTQEGVAVRVWGHPGLGLNEVLKPEISADLMRKQAEGAIQKALGFFRTTK